MSGTRLSFPRIGLPEMKEAPVGASSQRGSDGSLDGLDVRGLCALRALHDLERHTLPFGQRLVAVHPNRREMHEHIVAAFALDEAVALLVREPLNGALCQLWFLLTATTTARAPSVPCRRPMMKQAGV